MGSKPLLPAGRLNGFFSSGFHVLGCHRSTVSAHLAFVTLQFVSLFIIAQAHITGGAKARSAGHCGPC